MEKNVFSRRLFAQISANRIVVLDMNAERKRAEAMLNSYIGRFAAVYGVPPLQYIMRMKLDRAKELLSSGKSVNETAAAIGFTDPNYFTRFFKERTGVTPTEFVRRRLC